MQFNPQDAENLLDEGNAHFHVREAEDCRSQAGNDQIKLTLMCMDAKGQEGTIFDFLVAGKKTAWKVKNFCDSVGLSEKFQTGQLYASDCVGKTGMLIIKTQKDGDGKYREKSTVSKYINQDAEASKNKTTQPEPDFDDDLPFK